MISGTKPSNSSLLLRKVKTPICPKLDPYKATIDDWLLEDKKTLRKQCHTAKRVFIRLKTLVSLFIMPSSF